MSSGLEGTVYVAGLAVVGDHGIALVLRQIAVEGQIQWVRDTGREQDERNDKKEVPAVKHSQPRRKRESAK